MSSKLFKGIFSALVVLILFAACKNEKEKPKEAETPLIYFKVKTTWPHDIDAFTQGLVIHNGILYESTGQNGQSWIGIIDINSGKPDKKVELDEKYFGEGITIFNNKVYQLTYQTKVGFVYDLTTWKKLREFPQPLKEGWGITHDNKNLIMSEGSEKLFFVDTVSLNPVRTLVVTDENGPVTNLNELEYVEGYIFANIWQTNFIVKIDPQTGKVVGRLDLSSLAKNAALRNPNAEVLNGIAYHPTTKLLAVTGKNWPSVYILQLNK